MIYRGILGIAALCSVSGAYAATAHEPRGPLPTNDPATWVLPYDYPSKELREGITGTTTFKVYLDADGMILTCEIVQSSGSETLDATTCALVKTRAKFTPAMDSDGRAAPGHYTNRVRWTIPAPEPLILPREKAEVMVRIDIDKKGLVEYCEFSVQGENHLPPDMTPCARYPVGYQTPSVVNEAGEPIAVRLILVQSTEFVPR